MLGMEPAMRPTNHANVSRGGWALSALRKANASQRADPRDRASLGFASVPLGFEERRANVLCVLTTTERRVAATELAIMPRMASPNFHASATMGILDRCARRKVAPKTRVDWFVAELTVGVATLTASASANATST